MNNQEELSLKEKELLLKEKEIELRERELRLKEQEFRQVEQKKQKVENTINTVKNALGSITTQRKTEERLGLFSLRDADNANIFSSDRVLSRKGYLFFSIPYSILYLVILNLLGGMLQIPELASPVLVIVYIAAIILGIIPATFACIKRCRDCKLNFWWILPFCIVPFLGLYLVFAKSKVDLENYTTKWDTYSQSDEYQDSKKSANKVVWTIIALFLLIMLASFLKGFSDAANGIV